MERHACVGSHVLSLRNSFVSKPAPRFEQHRFLGVLQFVDGKYARVKCDVDKDPVKLLSYI